jgi:hypothetical protein
MELRYCRLSVHTSRCSSGLWDRCTARYQYKAYGDQRNGLDYFKPSWESPSTGSKVSEISACPASGDTELAESGRRSASGMGFEMET